VFDNKPGMEKLMVYLSPEPVGGDLRKRVSGYTPDFVSTPLREGVEISIGMALARRRCSGQHPRQHMSLKTKTNQCKKHPCEEAAHIGHFVAERRARNAHRQH
jgi:hypothetical protein